MTLCCILFLTGCGLDSGADVSVNPIANSAPVVNAGPDVSIRLPSNNVALGGAVTDDGRPKNQISIAWTIQSGPGDAIFSDANQLNTKVTFATDGTYVLQLTADDTALQTSDTVTVSVEAAPTVAFVSVSPVEVSLLASGIQSFSASGTDQLGFTIPVSIIWSATGGTIDQEGNYSADEMSGAYTITATDGIVSGTARVLISASPPTANAGGPYFGMREVPIQLDGSASADANNDIVSYQWDLDNDGSFDDATGVNASFSASGSGVFTVGLRVTDAQGASNSATTTVTITNFAPSANSQSVSTAEATALPITLTGSDPESDPLTFAISSGPINGALEFDGTNDYVDVPDHPDLDVSSNLTISAWIFPRTLSENDQGRLMLVIIRNYALNPVVALPTDSPN